MDSLHSNASTVATPTADPQSKVAEDSVEAAIARRNAGFAAIGRILTGHEKLDPASISKMSMKEKFLEAAVLGLPTMAVETLELLVAALVALGILNLIGIGEVIEATSVAVMVAARGLAAYEAFLEVEAYCKRAHAAKSEADLRAAGAHLAHAVSLAGIVGLTATLGKLVRLGRDVGAGVSSSRVGSLKISPDAADADS